jgi:hypothetical protein
MGCDRLWREAWELNTKQMDVWWIPSTSRSRAKPINALCLLCFYATVCEMRRDYSNELWNISGLFFTDFRAFMYGHGYLKLRIHHPDVFNVLLNFSQKNLIKISDVYWNLQPSASNFGGPNTLTEVFPIPTNAYHYAAKSILRVLSSSLFTKYRIVLSYWCR